tara:strand:+ start:1851 stop:2558 length:708 start_codon:yes stop_codon:yes gene_type:complete
MINLKVGDQQCKIPQAWNEINLKNYTKIYEIINQNIFVEPTEGNEPTTDADIKTLNTERGLHNIRINRRVFSEFTGIDKHTINQVDGNEMSETLMLMSNFLNSEISAKAIEPEQKKSFSLKGKQYFFPIAKMKTSTFGDYIEASQLDLLAEKNKAGRFGVIAEQMAVLCRENGEKYDEQLVAKKTKMFGDLTMDIVWEFLFFLTKQTNTLKKHSQMYSKAEIETTTDTQQNIGTL